MDDRSEHANGRSDAADLIESLRRKALPDECYETRAELGRGGMGTVLEVWEEALRRPLAKKIVRVRGRELDRQQVLRLLEEAQVTAQLTHPGVPPVHVLGVDAEGQPYFTMPVVRGHDLDKIYSLVRRGEEGWSVERALGVLQRVCETMAYAHSRGVVHRDLKPANVMVGAFGEVYVMDWGLARVLSRGESRRAGGSLSSAISSSRSDMDAESGMHTLDGAAVGTPSYMSPEQAAGNDLDARSDVYAMGAMLYTLLAGRAPYSEAHRQPRAEEILARIRSGQPMSVAAAAPDAPPALHAICSKAMERDPSRRYADMRDMAQDLAAFLERRVVRAYRTGPLIEFRMWVQRNRGTAGALAGLVLVALAGAGLVALSEMNKSAMEKDRNARILGLADAKSVLDLEQQDAQLWPAVPARLAALGAWVDEASALQSRITYHRETRAMVAAAGGSGTEDRWLLEQLDQLVVKLESFTPAIAAMRARRDLAATLRERSIDGGEARAAWETAIAAIRSSPAYGGWAPTPQLGLLPLGEDSQSGLWEFWHIASGQRPVRDTATGRWSMQPETGMVLVLVPGGTTAVGAIMAQPPPSPSSWTDAYEQFTRGGSRPYADFSAEPDERFHDKLRLDPYFLSKYETTQAQYERVVGSNPSEFHAGHPLRGGPTHPVERVSWDDARRALERFGLALPTDAQWEHACRAGTTTPFSFRASVEDVARHANIADASKIRVDDGGSNGSSPEVDDGHPVTAPAGSLLPNPYGLHDMHGNVWEWILERDGDAVPADGTGRRDNPAGSSEGVIRGGSWYADLKCARSSERYNLDVMTADQDVGFRAARAVEP